MRSALLLACLLAPALAAAAPAPDEALVAAGKQRAAQSPTRWEVRDVVHPKLGSIKVAIALNALTLQVKNEKIVSSVYVSCEKGTGNIAIELVNAPSSDFTRGLGPKSLPRLSCVAANGAKSEIAAKWEANELGDVLARGLSPPALRRCVALEILENVSLPPGWVRDSQPFSVEVAPYGREVDEVFGDCGENVVYAPELPANRAQPPIGTVASRPAPPPEPVAAAPQPSPPVPASPVAATKPAVAAPPSPPPAVVAPTLPAASEGGWRRARTIASGRTNVRASGGLDSALVTQLPPGMPVLVEEGAGDWWAVKPRSGKAFQGYVRRDRFTLE